MKIYIFECEPDWIEALNITFRSYKNKVKIIEKFVLNNNTETEISKRYMLFLADKK